ncbi:Hypothetical predicted protein [Olea europaea subsp. europaea]|uniref:Uncharacterized protein n=1 Tax=Olea europaea subsp. europaea TaxID=158383 RepID=A0A8S0T629_OLEEU|nr:Hypothetical predicted protein [Olea europaea subsp. europaea]
MNIRRLQKLNKEFSQKADDVEAEAEAEAEAKKLKAEVSTADELNEAGDIDVNNYVVHFHEIDKYDGLVDLAALKEEFFPAESSTLANDVKGSKGEESKAEPW